MAATMRSLFARTPDGDWIPISPDYGGFATWTIDDIDVAPSAPERIYLLRTGPYTGTSIHRTLDAGYTWDQISLPLAPAEHFVYTLAIHPTSPDTLFAGAFEHLFRSRDAGDSWEEIALSLPEDPIPTDLMIPPDRPAVLLMGARGDDPGIYRSPDLGESWERVFSGDDIARLAISPADPTVVYALGVSLTEAPRLYRSTDGGVTWALRSADPRLRGPLRIDPGDPGRIYMVGSEDDGSPTLLLRSTDGGKTWAVMATAEDAGVGSFTGLGIVPGPPGGPATLYLGTSFWGTLRTDDDGGVWEAERYHATYIGAVAHDPLHPGRVYMGTSPAMNQSLANGRLYVSEDRGASWSYSGESVTPGRPVGRVFAIRPSIHIPDRVWIGTSYGLFLSEDAGRTMRHTGSGLVRSIWEDPSDPDHLLFGTASAPTIPETPPRLCETFDGGAGWVEIRQFDEAVLDIEVDGTDGRLYCALGGLSLSGLSLPGSGGLFWRDDEAAWHSAPDLAGLHVSGLVIDVDDPDRLYVSTLDEGVLASTDRGAGWLAMNDGLEDTEARTIEEIRTSGDEVDLVVGTAAGTSRWDGDRWTSLADGMLTFPSGGDSVALRTTALDVDPASGRLYVGSAGRSGYALDLEPPAGAGGSGDAEPRRPIERAALQPNYPNPFNPSTTIPFDIPDPAGTGRARRVDLDIYSLRGARVRNLIHGDLDPGRHEIVWTGRDDAGRRVASGVYLCVLKVGGTTAIRKMMILQ
jgi:photosystem II stability/assembly factor-like uncharacterized protein